MPHGTLATGTIHSVEVILGLVPCVSRDPRRWAIDLVEAVLTTLSIGFEIVLFIFANVLSRASRDFLHVDIVRAILLFYRSVPFRMSAHVVSRAGLSVTGALNV